MEEKLIKLSCELVHYPSYHNFDANLIGLISAAREASQKAYAPYSKFNVGSAVLIDDNKIISGNNQENACYPNGLCAERVTLFSAISNHPDAIIKAMAITIDYTKTSNFSEPIFPCGACRQSILEYEDKQEQAFPIYILGAKDDVICIKSIKDILPFTFSKSVLIHYKDQKV